MASGCFAHTGCKMTSPRILVHRIDDTLDDEVRAAVVGAGAGNSSLHFHGDLRSTINAAIDFQPSIVMLEIQDNFDDLKTLVEETTAAVPDAAIIGVYDVNQISNNQSESSVMIRSLRLGVEDFLKRPIASPDLRQVIQTRLNSRRTRVASHGKLISFISNKGGVGKSTSAVNVAVEMAQVNPGRVALIDCSLQMGVCAVQLNLTPEATLVDAWQERERLDDQLLKQLMTVHDSGLHVLAAPSSAIDAADVDDAFLSRILLMARRSYDYVIIDTFPMFDRVVMTILDLSDQAVIVVENIVPTLQTVKGFFSLLQEFDFPENRQRILLNRFSSRHGSPRVADVANYLGRQPDYVVPYDHRILTAANTGNPFISKASRWSRAASAIRSMTADLASRSLPDETDDFVDSNLAKSDTGLDDMRGNSGEELA